MIMSYQLRSIVKPRYIIQRLKTYIDVCILAVVQSKKGKLLAPNKE